MITELKKCLFDGKIPDPGPVPTKKLTYNLGDGLVIKLWYREELWETGRYAPYQVLTEDGYTKRFN